MNTRHYNEELIQEIMFKLEWGWTPNYLWDWVNEQVNNPIITDELIEYRTYVIRIRGSMDRLSIHR